MKTVTIISKLILLAFFLMPNAILSQNQTINVNGTQIQVSTSLQKILGQVETVYANPLGTTMNEMYCEGPLVLSTFLGLIMHRQKIMMMEIKNVEHLKNRSSIEKEIMTFLEKLAQAHNYLSPSDNTSMTSSKLQVFYYEAINGNQNANFKNNIGLDPTTVNIAYLLDSPPNNNIVNNDYNNPTNTNNGITAIQPENNSNVRNEEPLYIELAEEEVPTEINLFGEVSGAAENNGIAPTGIIKKTNKNKSFQMEGGCDCPVSGGELNKRRNTNGVWSVKFYLDCNGNLNDQTYVECNYEKKTLLLWKQTQYVDGKKNGKEYDWRVSYNNTRYLEDEIDYANDVMHGIKKSWSKDEKTGRVYLYWEGAYVNGKLHGIVITHHPNGKIMDRYRYSNGNFVEDLNRR